MALIHSSIINCTPTNLILPNSTNPNFKSSILFQNHKTVRKTPRRSLRVVNNNNNATSQDDEENNSVGVKAALSMLRFYKREISPLLPNSCRYQPTCSDYSMIAYNKYGVAKGTVLTAWRLCRCNPLGGSGFDPPRWFDEASPPEE